MRLARLESAPMVLSEIQLQCCRGKPEDKPQEHTILDPRVVRVYSCSERALLNAFLSTADK